MDSKGKKVMARSIIIVEDEKLLREELSGMLRNAGYKVSVIEDFKDVKGQLLAASPNLILLDINLPGEDGFQICREVKKKSSIPIFVLTSRDQLKDELNSLSIGADEYLPKPFRKERLLARINNVLRRYQDRRNLLEKGELLLDKNTYTLYVNGKSVVLPPNQGKLLEAFMTTEKDYLTKEELSYSLWKTTEYIDENALQVNMTRLKKTILNLEINERIKTLRGIGYALVIEED